MGIRVYFSYGGRNGALDHFLSAPLEEFRAWYTTQFNNREEALIDVEPLQLSLLDDIMKRGAAAFTPETSEQARLIDIITDHFYAWVSWEKSELLVSAGNGELKVYHYRNMEKVVLKEFGDEAGRLWSYMLNGRPVGRSEETFPYVPIDPGYPNSYWTFEEASFLYHRMLPHKDDFFGLFGQDDETAGKIAFIAVENALRRGVGLVIEVA